MIFAEFIKEQDYYLFYYELVDFMKEKYENVESGLQGDAWIEITKGQEKVTIDTFTSMRFQIKYRLVGGLLLEDVISKLKNEYQIHVFDKPEPEVHEYY